MISYDVAELLDARLPRIEAAIRALGSQRDKPAPRVFQFRESQLFATNVLPPFTWSVRMRWEFFQIVADTADQFILRLGAATYRFACNDGIDGIFRIPFVVDPGITVEFDPVGGAGNLFVAYVVAYPDPS